MEPEDRTQNWGGRALRPGGGSLGAKGHSDQLSEMAAAPVRERVAVIVPGGDDAIIAAKSNTATIL